MIGKLTGTIDSFYDGFLILDVGGVGYRVFCSAKTASKMPAAGGSASLWIETQVREDHIHLIGFADTVEQQMFGLLSTVQGVGAKVALAILSALTPNDIQMAVMSGDGKAFTRASGVGPKLGVRLITELKGKMGALGSNETMAVIGGTSPAATGNPAMEEAISALANLGYARIEAGMVVANVLRQNPDTETSELIRLSLKEIGKGKIG
ncbi:MAG: Holliday junction branch migration protein RuvA [Alphaproteobacteria bacterium]|nr:Holliday junction branch migration protein RuvA [Alphaproteobacteria bacterium]